MYNNKLKINTISIFLIAIYLLLLIIPIINVISKITYDNFFKLIYSKQFLTALKNSFFLSFVSTVLSILISIGSALCVERTNIKLKNFWVFIFIMPMLLPSISHSFGLATLFGRNGILSNLIGINIQIYGSLGIVLGSILYSFPVAFIMFQNILKYEDGSVYNVCKIMNIPIINQFKDITFPFMKKTLILAFFSIFAMIITDYGVPIMIGAKTITLPVLMYNKTVASLDYGAGSVISLFLLFPAIIAFILDFIFNEYKKDKYINEKINIMINKKRDVIAYLVCISISLFIIIILSTYVLILFAKKYPINLKFTIEHIIKTINRGALINLKNSFIVAIFTSTVGTIFSFTSAYITTRGNVKYNTIIHLLSVISMAIPGIIIGFSYLSFFKGTIIYGTLIILIIVNIFHFISSPYTMAYNSLLKINMNIENVGIVLGLSRINIIFNVIIPKLKNTILEMFSYFFVNSMMTISAVAFLIPPAPKQVSLMINQFNDQLLIECAAFVSLLILISNLIIRGIIFFIKNI